MIHYIKITKLFKELFEENFDTNIPAYELAMLYSILDNSIYQDLKYFCETINTIDNADKLNTLYDKYYEEYDRLNQNFIQDDISENNIKLMIKLNTIAMLLDNSLEYSSIQSRCLQNIKELFGEANYLSETAKADKLYLSIDAKKFKKNEAVEDLPQCLKLYIALKKQNDKLHYLLVDNFEKNMSTCAKFLDKEYQNNFDRIFESLLKLLENFYDNRLCEIEELCPLVLTNYKSFVVKHFGGKSLGLAILKSQGFNIPSTWILSCGNKKYDLSFLDSNIHYAVRSSANAEDGNTKSFAGMFDTCLDVGYKELIPAINKVKNSINNERLLAYAKNNKLNEEFKMAVIIQEFIEPTIAGVWLGNGVNSGFLEWVQGNGEKLVSGKETPKSEDWSKEDSCSHSLTCNGEMVGDVLKKAQAKLYAIYNHLADIEFCIIGNELRFLQFRPVTKIVKNANGKCKLEDKNFSVKGIPCCDGIISGKVHFITENTKQDFEDGEILLVEYTSPEMIDVMLKSKGIISLYGGFLCHAGIIAREFDIPCICGIGFENKELIQGKMVLMNATNGTIKLLD